MERSISLFEDDFKKFAIGEFPFDKDHSATGEYHYVVEEGYRGDWIDQICNHSYNGTGPTWIITEANGKHYMEQMRIEKNRPHRIFPTLQTGTLFWKDYTYKATIRRLSTKGVAGIAFCMQNSLNTLALVFDQNSVVLVHRHKEEVKELTSCEYSHDCDTYYKLKVECIGDTVKCFVNGELLLTYQSQLVQRGGKIGITADCPTQFTDVVVKISSQTQKSIQKAEKEHHEKLEKLQGAYPKMKLWKKIDLKNFGTSRQIRFGHLTGTKEWYIVLAQAQKRVNRDAYPHMNCLTAIDLDGNILWQRGEPSKNSKAIGKVSADLPFQVYDIDGDGIDEVIVGFNFEIQILDGRTGEIKKSVKTPLSEDEDESLLGVPYRTYAFDRINPDGIRIANFSGKERPSDILIKDRYCRLYALDADLNLLWKYKSKSPKNTGHYPMAVDVNGDGHDELLCGYTLLDCHGKEIWTYPIQKDHVDEIIAGKFMAGSEKGYFACVAGSEGFFIGDFQGNIVKRDRIGHAQRISVGNYCPDRPGFELVVSNFWGHQGIVYLYDCFGNPLWEMENELNGNVLSPVNWRGDGADLFLLNADVAKGGLIDGEGNQVVKFPEDGHPTLCCEVIDLCNDNRDEIVVWDYETMYIYTQENVLEEEAYAPVKYPHYNASNYRGEYSFPDQSYITFREIF
jgi:outer membrane protein assembly factor BamB